MKKKIQKSILLIILSLLFVVSVVVLAACDNEKDPNAIVEGKGNTVKVVLDSIKSGTHDYRLKPGSPIPEPGKTEGTTAPVAEGFIFDGYYEGTLDSNGNVIYGDKWDFSRKVSQDMTLYGKWLIQYKIRVNFVLDGKVQAQFEDVYVPNNVEQLTSIREISWSGNTFLQLYEDNECKQELEISTERPFKHGCTQEEPVREIYAKFMAGVWRLVKAATDLRTVNTNTNIYLLNDIDMATLANSEGYSNVTIPAEYKGTIDGNGYTIKNLNFYRKGTTGSNRESNYCLGLFSTLSGATIRNITFENCTVTGSVGQLLTQVGQEYFYGFLAGQAKNSVLQDIKFVNCTLNPLQFEIRNLTPEKEAEERTKIVQDSFIGEIDNNCQVKNVTTDGIQLGTLTTSNVVALIPETSKYKFC